MTSRVLKRRFQNQLTKVSRYKQAAQLTPSQLAFEIGHGFPGTEASAEASQHWENTFLGSQNQNPVGKRSGHFCWPTVFVGCLCKSTLNVILEKWAFRSTFCLACGLGKLAGGPESILGFIKLVNAFSPWGIKGEGNEKSTEGITTFHRTKIYLQDCNARLEEGPFPSFSNQLSKSF